MIVKKIVMPSLYCAIYVSVTFYAGNSVFSQTYSESVLADAPLTYWQFNNDLQDTQGNVELHPAASPQFVAGMGENNRSFSSSGGKAWAAAFGVESLYGVQDFSYEMWINLKGDNEGRYILQRYAGGSQGGENSLVYQNGQINFIGRSGELSEPAVVSLPNQTDAWHHLVLSYEYMPSTIVFYLDGEEAYRNDTAFLEPIFGEQDYEIYIGATRTNPEGRIFNGFIDEVAIYDFALSAEQAKKHCNASFPTEYAKAVAGDSPLIYWRFENNYKDEMGGTNLLSSGVQFVDGPSGSPNKALLGRVTSTSAEILYNMESFTYELWFNPIFKSSNSYILFRRAGSAQHAVIFAYKPDGLEFFFLEGNVRPLVAIPNQTDRWYHCVVVNDTSVPEMRIYIDGVMISRTPGRAVSGPGNMVVIGGSDQGDNFNGYIDEISIYDYVLSEARILAHYNAPIKPVAVCEWCLF